MSHYGEKIAWFWSKLKLDWNGPNLNDVRDQLE